ncbi:MAG: ribosome assembly RNA-binding protein YhbY [Gemmatimonadaceae bacterium]|nr:ribosome assembly RNA-binding protein YhbY [Gemmatimonadaceae bacterium]
MALTSKERAALRAKAHHLSPKLHIGKEGVTDPVLQTLDDVLRTQELVKVALTKQAEDEPKELAHALAQAMRADVVQVIGRTLTLFREKEEE